MRYIIANWKSNMDLLQVNTWLKDFEQLSQNVQFKNTILIAPPFPYLQATKKYTALKKNMETCGQDIFLGLEEFCNYCIVGHSERSETPEVVIKKRDACLKVGITPIVCFVQAQQLKSYYVKNALFAWENPQNISRNGKYQSQAPEKIREGINNFKELFPGTQILYGGSVNINNAKNLAEINKLDGILIGHAGLDPKHFLDIITEFEKL